MWRDHEVIGVHFIQLNRTEASKSMHYGRRGAGDVRAGRERKEERDESWRPANRRRKADVYDVLGSTNTNLTLRLAADHVKSTVILNDASGGE